MGAPAEVVAQIRAEARAERPDAGLPVMAENGPAVRLFLALATQWNQQPLSTLTRAILVRTGRRPSAEAVEVAAARLPRDESVELRLALVELLGAAAAWNGAAREALARWFPAETEARVQAAIGRYLPAELLVPARRG